ncbi:MAG: Aquaporin, partial [Acidimicrobiales bacterium]|nr:Aquaporin [Acidimicrobiales bacterium]
HNLALGATTLTITPAEGFTIEALLAFFLVTVVLSTAVAGRAGNLAPLAIGMTLTLNIIMGGALTGAAFNPARALGPMIATGKLDDAWLYVLAPLVGAAVAALVAALAGPGSLAGADATDLARVHATLARAVAAGLLVAVGSRLLPWPAAPPHAHAHQDQTPALP